MNNRKGKMIISCDMNQAGWKECSAPSWKQVSTEGLMTFKFYTMNTIPFIFFSTLYMHAQLLQSCLTFFWPRGLWPARLLCLWDSPGKNTGLGFHPLLQGIFHTRGSNLGLLHCRQILYCLSHQGSPHKSMVFNIFRVVLQSLPLILEHFHHPQRKPYIHPVAVTFQPSQPYGTTFLLSIPMDLPTLGIPCKWNCMWSFVTDFFRLVFEVHPCCSICISFLFLWQNNISIIWIYYTYQLNHFGFVSTFSFHE